MFKSIYDKHSLIYEYWNFCAQLFNGPNIHLPHLNDVLIILLVFAILQAKLNYCNFNFIPRLSGNITELRQMVLVCGSKEAQGQRHKDFILYSSQQKIFNK